MNKKINNLKINRITFLITGIIFIFLGVFFIPFLFVGGILLFLAYKANKTYKELLIDNNDKSIYTQVEENENKSPYVFLRFKVAGVTFKNGRKSRQSILRAFKWGDETPENVDFELYEYENRPAVYVKINDKIVGNIPADTTEKFLEHENLYIRDNIHCDIYGGNKLDDGTRTNYGCEIIIRYLKEEL